MKVVLVDGYHNYWSWLYWRPEMAAEFSKHGIQWETSREWTDDADVVMSTPDKVNSSYAGPLIVFEPIEMGAMTTVTRKLLGMHDILAVVKIMSYPQLAQHNEWTVEHRVLGGEWKVEPIDENALMLIRVATTYQNDMFTVAGVGGHLERSIDVSMCVGGRSLFDVDHYRIHRQMAVQSVAALNFKYEVALFYARLNSRDAFVPKQAIHLMKRSKAVCCPWGVTEMSIRDYHAALCGCTLIKPWERVDLNPSPYKHVVHCSQDYVDLEGAVAQAVEGFDACSRYEFAKSLSRRLTNESQIGMVVDMVKGIVL